MTKIEQAKKNIINNYKSNYTNNRMDTSDVERFLQNSLDQFQAIIFLEMEPKIQALERDYNQNLLNDRKEKLIRLADKYHMAINNADYVLMKEAQNDIKNLFNL